MKNFYKYGIDLGTTNSCVAKKRENDIIVFLNNEQMHVTPSAVYINPNGSKYIGTKAKSALKHDPKNVKTQFKRLMGTNEKLKFKNINEELSPEQLSSEILKSLKNDVKRLDLEGEELNAAVITVPASFNSKQCNSTKKAAEMAGIEDVLLLQEPIAAALAYGAKPENKEQNWIVFDLGGGTLDIALVSNKNNRIQTLNHNGNNFLGGKDIDRKIVDEIILPKLDQNYNLPDRKNEKIELLYNKLLLKAEESKIILSDSEEAVIDLFDLGVDENGNLIEGEIIIKRDELETILKPMLNDVLPLIKKTVEEASYSYSDITKLLLAGGTTQIPFVRELLKKETGLPIDYSINPVTVVAKGAAIFAFSNEIEKAKSPFDEVTEIANLEVEYNSNTSNKREIIIGKFSEDKAKNISEVKIFQDDGIWESGWIELSDQNSFEAEVLLKENSWNNFIIEARDNTGNEIELLNNIISIKHDDNHQIVENEPLPHTISIEVNKDDVETALVSIIEKNANLPVEASEVFEAYKNLLPNKKDEFLAVKIWEGERFKYPQENEYIGLVKIDSTRIDKPIRKGDELEVKVKINRSRLIEIKVVVFKNDLAIPETFQMGEYKSSSGNGTTKKNNTSELINLLSDQCYEHLNQIKVNAYKQGEEKIQDFNKLMQELDSLEQKNVESIDDKTVDLDEKHKLYNEFKKLHRKITDFKNTIEKESGVKLKKEEENFSNLLSMTDELVDEYGEEQDSEELNQIKKDYRYYNEYVDEDQEKENIINRNTENLKKLYSKVLFDQYEIWVSHYKYFKKGFALGNIQFSDREKAAQTLKDADKAYEEENKEELINSVYILSRLAYEDDIDRDKKFLKEMYIDPGIRQK